MEEDEYDYKQDYEFMRFIQDDEGDFYLPTNEHNPKVVIELEDGMLYMWTPEGLYHLIPHKIIIGYE